MSYRSRLDDIPILKSAATTVPAVRYTRVRLALRRLENPLRIELTRLRCLVMFLVEDAWSFFDRILNDLPVVAWTDFAPREALHTPLRCSLHYYHAHAAILNNTVLIAMDHILAERLARNRRGAPFCT